MTSACSGSMKLGSNPDTPLYLLISLFQTPPRSFLKCTSKFTTKPKAHGRVRTVQKKYCLCHATTMRPSCRCVGLGPDETQWVKASAPGLHGTRDAGWWWRRTHSDTLAPAAPSQRPKVCNYRPVQTLGGRGNCRSGPICITGQG